MVNVYIWSGFVFTSSHGNLFCFTTQPRTTCLLVTGMKGMGDAIIDGAGVYRPA